MNRAELETALNDLWRAHVAVLRARMSAPALDPMPQSDVGALEDQLARWFTPET